MDSRAVNFFSRIFVEFKIKIHIRMQNLVKSVVLASLKRESDI